SLCGHLQPQPMESGERRPLQPGSISSPWCGGITEMDRAIDGAFADPVMQSQSVFRALMDALANPGTMQKLAVPRAFGTSMTPELVSALLTLSDRDTSIWLDEVLRSEPANLQFVSFHTGAPVVVEVGKATFAFVC